MKPFRFFRASFAALTVIFTLTCGIAFAQIPNPQNNGAFANATRLETESPTQAMDSYFKISNTQSGQNKELAAEALVRAMQFGIKVLDPNQPAPATDLARVQREEIQSIVGDRAHEASKQLNSHYSTTNAAKFANEQNLQHTLEKSLDKRNSTTPTYKIIDAMVAATGRVPSFSYWFALLLIAVLVKTITFPLTLKMYKSQREMQKIQPLMKELQEKYKDRRQELGEKTMALYKEHNVNPMASCLPMLIQMPFLLWVYNMIRLYEFHFQQGKFLWIGSSISEQYPLYLAPSLGAFDIVLVTIYALSNYLTMKLTPPSDPSMAQQQKSMAVMMTAMMFFFSLQFRWAAAFTFYWLCLNFISTYQQYKYIYKPNKLNAAKDGVEIILPSETKSASSGSKGSSTATTTTTNNGSRVRTTNPGKVTPLTPVPNDAMRARPRRKPKK